MTAEIFTYELLCVDSNNASKIKSVDQFAYSLMSNCEMLMNPKYEQKSRRIVENDLAITLDRIDTKNSFEFAPQNSFRITVTGVFDHVEKLRIVIINHIKKQDFPLIYVLNDEVSEKIAQAIYPQINKVENRLRRYIIKFFVTKLGADWWRVTADSDMQFKVQQRKNNETYFAPIIDNKAYLIDFGELGKIVFTQSSGFISKDDIIKRVLLLTPTADSVVRLKEAIQSNYTKYFKETFKEAGFQSKWEALEKIRNKVAHNNLFTNEDLKTAHSISNELLVIIDSADKKVENLVFSQEDVTAIQDAIIEKIDMDSDKEEASSWRDEIQEAIQSLGGEAELSEIYDYISQHTTRELPVSWRPIVRFTLQTNSSDTASFTGKHDVFRWIERGKWGIRSHT